MNSTKTPFIVLLFLMLYFETKKTLKQSASVIFQVRDLSVKPVNQLKRQLDVRFFYA